MAAKRRSRFTQFIAPHLEALHRTGYRLCRHRADAEDLVQDVCVRALKAWQNADVAAPRAWLLRIQYHLHVDGLRQVSGRREEAFDEGTYAESTADMPEPAAAAEALQRVEALDAVWRELTTDQQALLALYAEGYRLAEIAAIAEVPVGAIKARLHRARTRLGRLIEQRNRAHTSRAAIAGDAS
jgi:RNA polymerase sigma-70 factor (ECF subfamily)